MSVDRRRRTLLIPGAALLLALAVAILRPPGNASAHAVLLRSDPPAGATLQQPPRQIQLWFSEGISRDLTSVRILDSNGREVGPLKLSYNDADNRQVTATGPELSKGSYVIAWSSFSSVDGHRLDGSVSFGIGVATSGGSTTSSPDFRPSAGEVAARWVSLIGALGLAGAITIAFLLGRPAAPDQDPRRLLMLLSFAATAMLAAGDIAVLLLRADRAGGLGEAGNILTGSAWGHLWIVRMWLVAFGAGAVVTMLISLRVWFRVRLAALGVTAAVVLLTESLSSHAATRTSSLPIFADFIHLVASAVWIGSVLGLPALLLWSRRDPSRRNVVVQAVKRFACVAAVSFGLILISGVYRTVQEVPTLRAFVDTTYGKALTVKLALVLAVLALGATNFLVARWWDRQRASRIWSIFTRSIPAEALVGASVVVAVALMTLATPAASLVGTRNPGAPANVSSVVTQRGTANDLNVDLTVQPSTDGGQRVSVALARNGNASSAGKPLMLGPQGLGITQVRFRFKPLDSSIGESRAIAAQSGNDTFAVDGQFLPFKGRWEIDVDVRRKNADDATAKFTIDTEQANRPAYVRTMLDDTIVYSIAQAAGTPGLLLAAGGEFYQSTDLGVTWKPLGGPGAYRVIADPSSPSGFYAAGTAGLLKSGDGGVSWKALYAVKGDAVSDVTLLPADPSVIIIATESGISRSDDAGATWRQTLPSASPEGGSSQPDQWSRLATASDGTLVAGRRPGVLAVSRDAGATWQELKSNLNLPGGVMGLMIDPADSRRWYVGSMGSGVWGSTDAGADWLQVTSGVSPNGHGAGFVKTSDGKVIVATTGQGVLTTSDGTNWGQVGDDGIAQGIAEAITVATGPGGEQSLIVAGIGMYRLDLRSGLESSGQIAQ